MTPAQINRMRSEWEDFRGGDYRRDHERAQFFRRWRRRYATGNATRRAAGDIQFSDDVNAHLPDIKGQTALNYCRLLTLFRSERTWVNLGGYRSMLHLANMPTTAARNRVKTAALAKADAAGEPGARRLLGCRFAILGLGDSNYTSFMKVPRDTRRALLAMGAEEFLPAREADEVDGLESVVDPWLEGLLGPLKAATAGATDSAPAPALAALPAAAGAWVGLSAVFSLVCMCNVEGAQEGSHVHW